MCPEPKLGHRADIYRIFTTAAHLSRSDSNPFSSCAATATLCFPGLNSRRLVVKEIPFTSPVASGGTGREPSGTRFGTPTEIS